MNGLLLPCHNLGTTLAYHNLGLELLSLKGPYKSELTSGTDLPGFVLLTAGGASTGLGWGSYGGGPRLNLHGQRGKVKISQELFVAETSELTFHSHRFPPG